MDSMTLAFLEGCRNEYDKGNQWALMQALMVCAYERITMPAWVAEAYIKAFTLVQDGHVISWDDVFGKPVKKGAHIESIRRKKELMSLVYARIREMHEKDGRPVDVGLFEEVGSEFNIGKTLAQEYYYSAKKIWDSLYRWMENNDPP